MSKIPDTNTIVVCEGTTNISSVVGNLTSFTSNYFKSKFPKGFFKDLFISESLNSVNLKKSDLIKYKNPFLVIKPEILDDEGFMGTLPQWYTSNRYIAKNRYHKYYPVLQDEEHGIYIYTIPTRLKLAINTRIKLASAMYMYNVKQHMKNKFEKDGYEFVNNVHLQSEVPKVMMINLAETLGYNLSKLDDKQRFEEYLKKVSINKIECVNNLSTGNDMYAFNYTSNLLMNYPEIAQGEKNVQNLVVKNSLVSFQFTTELWIPNKFILELPNNRREIKEDLDYGIDSEKFKFNMVINTDYILPIIDNKHLLIRKTFIPDVNIEVDNLNFSSLISDELKKVIEVLHYKKLFNNDYFEVYIMANNKYLNKLEYEIDYKNFIAYTKTPMKNTTYTILLYGNLEVLNGISEKIMKGEDFNYIEKSL